MMGMSFEADTQIVAEGALYHHKNYKLFYARIGAGVVFVLGLAYALVFAPSQDVSVTVEVRPGESAREIARILKHEHIIRSEDIFLLYLWARGGTNSIRSGSYLFSGKYALSDVTYLLTSARRIELTIAVPEGSSLRGVASILEGADVVRASELWDITGVPASNLRHTGAHPTEAIGTFVTQYAFLKDKPTYATLEGYLFPDTYRIYKDADAREIVDRMLKNFQERLTQAGIFDKILQDKRNLYEVLTVASMLEEEARTYEDRRMIAGIIQNRIRANIPLQIDATLMYVTGRGTHLLTEEDLNLDSPYNTYEYKGLPIGPISSPGLESIRAALDPAKSDYLYYLSDKDGRIYYSKTFEEHKAKKLKYLN
ncbi:MAG: hypothetical protein A3C84_02340 [Candidatus Ryanbacteria bacterium RIFCSPHIGHO2_02_FULL_48_12]|uniref:Endolytic murein transglycosylase n=1 Tax=Candidatus Ryanbacteria bacterium RIFCSPHIGHO2_01_FULL_48_27 TaxID=1802115 RepID=A0A1G2G6L7_9BACT|nr:MAG: hypothetical protein A2756_01755 [Candidatus Ryanbacteria bacterium RIFCSPHIGHO2_01_FULL_48_27]OGZ48890.1 MAG: hypothetical protein A3C84_02340 [Candidatus Ryanbacteria bacterium RIFCSPHIGHO2_02_FULL_48_12]